MCQQIEGFPQRISNLNILIAGDHKRDWEDHLLTVKNLLPIFSECDEIHYLAYASCIHFSHYSP